MSLIEECRTRAAHERGWENRVRKSNAAAFDEAATQLEAMQAALAKAILQLEYLDERFPTGTTPGVIAQIRAPLDKSQGKSSQTNRRSLMSPPNLVTLKPCPFCGVLPLDEAGVEEVRHPFDNCRALSGLWFTREAWNTRKSEPVGDELVERVALLKIADGDYDVLAANPNRWPCMIARKALGLPLQNRDYKPARAALLSINGPKA